MGRETFHLKSKTSALRNVISISTALTCIKGSTLQSWRHCLYFLCWTCDLNCLSVQINPMLMGLSLTAGYTHPLPPGKLRHATACLVSMCPPPSFWLGAVSDLTVCSLSWKFNKENTERLTFTAFSCPVLTSCHMSHCWCIAPEFVCVIFNFFFCGALNLYNNFLSLKHQWGRFLLYPLFP